MIRVLYVIGWGRSGSSMLDTALGSFPGVVSTGELRHLWERGLGDGDPCGCGVPLPTCPFWTRVLDRVEAARAERGARPPRPEPSDVARLQRTVARIRHAPRIPGASGPQLAALRALTADVARAVTGEADSGVLVDSSKRPPDAALYLGHGAEISLHLVHLIRDPRAVAYSWRRPKLRVDAAVPSLMAPHPPLRSSGHWLVWNLMAEQLAARATTYRRVRYEDLVADPAMVLGDVLSDVGLRPDLDEVVTPRGLQVAISHTVSGNPSRMAHGTVPVRLDDAWVDGQPYQQRLAATIPALPLLRRYGYPLR